MISSSLPPAGTLRHPANFGVYSLISNSLQFGGYQQEAKPNDEILFAFDAFNSNSFLKLTGLLANRSNPFTGNLTCDRRTVW